MGEIGEGVAALAGESGERGPDSFAPEATGFAARSLRDASVDDAVAHLLFGQIVGGFDSRIGHEREVIFAVFLETLCHGTRLAARFCSASGFQKRIRGKGDYS